MMNFQNELINNGFTIIDDIYTPQEIQGIISLIDNADQSNSAFRKTADLFAIRRFLKEIPETRPLIFNPKFRSIISSLLGSDHFVVKSIYFDKPAKSNWFVGWHQDLTIAVDRKAAVSGFGPWTVKQHAFAVQAPVGILQNNFTVRIHLDDTDENNGALKVLSGSHHHVLRTEDQRLLAQKETICPVKAGGIMVMRPLLMHASNRTTTNKKRRVVHIEFSNADLPNGIAWAEKEALD